MAAVLFYILYLGRWLTYNWADNLIYGTTFGTSMEPFAADGPATLRLPVNTLHCVIRIGIIPAFFLLVGFLSATGLVPRHSQRETGSSGQTVTKAPPVENESGEARRERQFAEMTAFFQVPAVFSVPLDPEIFSGMPATTPDQQVAALESGSVTPVLQIKPEVLGKHTYIALTAWSPGCEPPPGTLCMDMTWTQLLQAFLAANATTLYIKQPKSQLVLVPYFANRLLKELPHIPPAPLRYYQSP